MKTEIFPAIKAFVVYKNKVLILRESKEYLSPNRGKYDLPGGKVKPGENFKEGLLREIEEETNLKIKIGKPFHIGEWKPIVNGKIMHIIGTFIECFSEDDNVVLCEDHDKYVWIDPSDYQNYNLIDTNKPAFESYLEGK